MNRRELLQLALAAIAAENTAFPAALTSSIAGNGDWKPAFLNTAQVRTVMALTECILPKTDTPGANDAKVYRYIDLLLVGGAEDDRAAFLQGLMALDEKARRTHQPDFSTCTGAQQTETLLEMEKANDKFLNRAKQLTIQIYAKTPEGFKELNRFGVPGSYAACKA